MIVLDKSLPNLFRSFTNIDSVIGKQFSLYNLCLKYLFKGSILSNIKSA